VSGPKYRDAVDVIKSKITPGDVGTGITLRRIRELTGATDSTSRRVASELVAEGILENHPGAPYTIIATPEDAASRQPGPEATRAQIAALQDEVAELRQRAGRIEADLAALYGQTGHKYPRRGNHDRANAAAGGGRQ
jgi:DNA-binding transcriptional MocR family regulator